MTSLLLVALLLGVPAAATVALDTDPLDELDVLAVRDGDPTQVLFSAPARFLTSTLTNADVEASIDGEVRQMQLRQLGAADQEIVVVIDTTVDMEELRRQQAAIVELALGLPSGATMRIVDAQGQVSEPLAASGPAIRALRLLEPNSDGDLTTAVQQARTALNQSARQRGTLLVVGTDLASRLDPIDGLPFDRVAYVVDVGGAEGGPSLLGPDAGGTVIRIASSDQLLAAMDQVGEELRSLYVAQVARPTQDAQALTLSFPDSGDVADQTVALGTGTLRPQPVDGDQAQDGDDQGGADAEQDAPAPEDEAGDQGAAAPQADDDGSVDLLVPIALGALIIGGLVILLPVMRHRRQRPRTATTAGAASPPDDGTGPEDERGRAAPGWAAWAPVDPADDTGDVHEDVAADDGSDARAADDDADAADAVDRRVPPIAAAAVGAAATGRTADADPVPDDDPPRDVPPRRGRRRAGASASARRGRSPSSRRRPARPSPVPISGCVSWRWRRDRRPTTCPTSCSGSTRRPPASRCTATTSRCVTSCCPTSAAGPPPPRCARHSGPPRHW